VLGTLALSIVAATMVTAIAVLHGSGQSLGNANAESAQLHKCSASGCAVVSLSRTLPPNAVFYGASCTGINGSWFFNAIEGGGNDELRPSYSLRWSFSPGLTLAKPSGQINVIATSTTKVALSLRDGSLSLTGAKKPHVQVAATGTLVVEISGAASDPVLKFTETGLLQSENALGLVSPFDVGGNALIVPVKTVKSMAGC
jgi:hypothetical protein